MEEAHRRGLARAIGVSNFTVQHLEVLKRTATIKCKHIMSVYGVSADTMELAISDYPDVGEYLHRVAKSRVQRIQQLHINATLETGADILDLDDEEDSRTPLFQSIASRQAFAGGGGGGLGGIIRRTTHFLKGGGSSAAAQSKHNNYAPDLSLLRVPSASPRIGGDRPPSIEAHRVAPVTPVKVTVTPRCESPATGSRPIVGVTSKPNEPHLPE